MTPNFEGARTKVARAFEHLQALDAEIGSRINGRPYGVGGHYKPESAEIDLYAIDVDFPLLDWGVRIGDCLHNLRSALDHITWQLAVDHLQRLPTNKEAPRIQFPIEDDLDGFNNAGVRKFISASHIAALDRFQPYHHGKDAPRHKLAILRRLSNADKHRVVHAAAITPTGFEFEFTDDSGFVGYDAIEVFQRQPLIEHARIGRITGVIANRTDPEVKARGPFSVNIILDDLADSVLHQEAVTVILGRLGGKVQEIVEWFTSEFSPVPHDGSSSLPEVDESLER